MARKMTLQEYVEHFRLTATPEELIKSADETDAKADRLVAENPESENWFTVRALRNHASVNRQIAQIELERTQNAN